MPKTEIDYSNTIIYKIICKDSSVKEIYVGHTTNFVQRKHNHKQNCINENSPNYECKLYKIIRDNGGWNNWKIEIVNFFNCKNHFEAKKKEQEYFHLLNGSIQSMEYSKDKEPLQNEFTEKNRTKFICEKCDFVCSKISNYNAHIATIKHQRINKNTKINIFICECGKEYKHVSSLCKHKNLCKQSNTYIEEHKVFHELVQQNINLITQNQEFKELLIDQNKQLLDQNKQLIEISKTQTITQITTNCNNTTNKFNLNFFLNEQCKDALNLGDFINSLHLQLSDLQTVGKLGYSEGISKIFVNGLKELDLYKRPLHCSDIKREILYVKDEDKWQKEDDENTKMKHAIQHITHKNIKQIPEWVKNNPTCKNSDSKQNEEYMQLVSNSMTGNSLEEQIYNMNKIISKVAKEVIIDKDHL